MKPSLLRSVFLRLVLVACAGIIGGCQRATEPETLQGYAEGEYVYVAAPLGGRLETLSVSRGTEVAAGAPLFVLESVTEQAASDEAKRRLAQAKATLEDARKGKRPPEIQAMEAQLAQARAALELSTVEFARQEQLNATGAAAKQELDRARSAHAQDAQRVAQLEADLQTANLGQRADMIAAAEANVQALEATLAKAEWDLSQKKQSASEAGLIFDTLFRPGEWVPAGRPVVALLPPRNIKVRAYVPEPRIGAQTIGQSVRIRVDGRGAPLTGRINFISPKAEYTPPVIYSRETRSKLVFLIEITFAPEVAATLHPGQPVDVLLGPTP